MSAPASIETRRAALQFDVYMRAWTPDRGVHARQSDVLDFARAVMEKPLLRDEYTDPISQAKELAGLERVSPSVRKHPMYATLAWFVVPWRRFVRAYTAARAGTTLPADEPEPLMSIHEEVSLDGPSYFDSMDVPTLEWMRVRHTRPATLPAFSYNATWFGRVFKVHVFLEVNGRRMNFGLVELKMRDDASVYLALFYTHHRTTDPSRTIWDALIGRWVDARGVMTAVLTATLGALSGEIADGDRIDLRATNIDTNNGDQSKLEAYYASLSFEEDDDMDRHTHCMYSTVARVRRAIAADHDRKGIAVKFNIELPGHGAPRMSGRARVGRIGSRLSVHD
ncbi:MAG: hypothetical protein Q7V62_01825 [Actinomycetota bacterium]|nr:hypothetical protein [Actinomycetota bacterium]